MKKIKLTKEKVAIIDNEDFDRINKIKWYFDSMGYASTKGKELSVRMHRFIMNTPKGMDTDHINHNKLDNRKNNLRICTHQENIWNIKVSKGKSKYRGVYFNADISKKRNKRWVAQTRINGKSKTLGYFLTEKEAGDKYKEVINKIRIR